MKRYLLVKHWMHDKKTVQTDMIERKNLLDLKDGMCEAIIDTQNNTFFNAESNSWDEIKTV